MQKKSRPKTSRPDARLFCRVSGRDAYAYSMGCIVLSSGSGSGMGMAYLPVKQPSQ